MQLFLLALTLLLPTAVHAENRKSPNVLLIYSDDQGTLDLNCYGSKDLITPNLQAYEALALHLAQTPSRLLEIKSRIKANRATKAMFDTKGKVADLEALFQVMWKRHCQGLPAAPLKGASIG